MIKVGVLINAVLFEERNQGWLLKIEGKSDSEIFVNPEGQFRKGKETKVFVLKRDENGSWWGSLKLPEISLGEVGFLQLKNETSFGYFFDWGLEKDLFCPLSLATRDLKPGLFYPVLLMLDKVSNRLMANLKWRKLMAPAGDDYYKSRQVNLLVIEPSESGFVVLVDQKHLGMLYENQIFQTIKPGQTLVGFVNKVRDEDGKLDILLQRPGYKEVDDAGLKLLKRLKEGNGKVDLGDKSPADEIYAHFQMSKKTFKKALGQLFRMGKIGINDFSFWLVVDEGD